MTAVPDPAGPPTGALADAPTPAAGAAAGASRRQDRERGRDVVLAAKGGGVVFAGKLFAWAGRFTIAVFLARVLGADRYGLYNLALTAATIGASFAALGLDSAVIRYVSIFQRRADPAGVRGALQVGVGLPGLAGIAIGAAMFLFPDQIATAVMNKPEAAPFIRISAFLVPLMALNRQLGAALQGLKKIEYGVFVEQFSQPPIRFAILLVFLAVGLGVAEAVVASTLAAGAATVMLAWLLIRRVRAEGPAATARRETWTMVVFSVPVYFSNIVTTIGHNLQTLALANLSTLAAVGIFAIASHVNMLASMFHTAVVQSSMAIFADLQERGDRVGLARFYQTTSKWTFSLNLPLFVMIVLFPAALLSVFGSDFVQGAPALIVLGLEALVLSATGTSGVLLDMTGHTRVKFLNSTLSVALALVLNILLIPPLGLMGAAIAALGAGALVNLLRVGQVWILVGVQPYGRSFVKPIAAGCAAFAVGFVLTKIAAGLEPIVLLLLGGTAVTGIYAVVLAALGLTDEDRLVLQRAMRRFRRIRDRADAGSAAEGPADEPANIERRPDDR